jgi:putative hemolysin
MNDTTKSVLGIAAVLVLVLLNGFFVAAEFALVSVRKSRIDQLANEGNRRARGVQKALEHLDAYIAATQLGITMASLALGFVGEPAAAHLIEPLFAPFLPPKEAFITSHGVAIALAFAIVTALHIVIGELAPKSIALQRPDATSLWVTTPLDIFVRVFRPFIIVLNNTGNFVVRLLGLEPAGEHAHVHSVDELELLVHSTREAGLIEEQQEKMVAGVFDFEEIVVRKVMTPRLDITAIPVDADMETLIHLVTSSGHSRLPVYEGNLDNIIGIVHIKDLLRSFTDKSQEETIRDVLRPPYFVPENKKAGFLLAEMRRSKTQIAIVRDEYGVVTGVVTIEDLLEEIVGDIQDEYDTEESQITQIDAHTFLVDGTMLIEDFNEATRSDLPTDTADTIGGFVFDAMGHQPAMNESAAWNGLQFTVTATDGRRIQQVRVVRTPTLEPEAEEDD